MKITPRSAVDLHADPFSDASLAAMRAWLLKVDFMGYLPALVVSELEGRLWTLFWFGIRRIDDLVDHHGFEILDDETMFPDDLDAMVALEGFLAAAPPSIHGRRRLVEQIRSFAAERQYLALGRPLTVRELFSQWYLKAMPGAYMVQRLQLSASSEAEVRRIVKLAAVGLQMFDDLTDLQEDLALGRLWIAAEELALLGHTDTSHGSLPVVGGEPLTRHRTAVCLTYFLAVYDAGAQLSSPVDRQLAMSFAAGWLRFIQQGFLKIHTPGAPKPMDALQKLLQRLPGGEGGKTPVLHSIHSLMMALPLPQVDIKACRQQLRELGGCPEALAPDVALAIIGELEVEGDAQSFDTPRPDATALERALLSRTPRWTAQDFQRSLRQSSAGSPAHERAPGLRAVLASGAELARRSAGNYRLALDGVVRRLRRDASPPPVSPTELDLRIARDGADWFALGIEAVAATARSVQAPRTSQSRRSPASADTRLLAGRAVVIGGSVAGLVAARVLADHFEEVVVIERDALDGGRRKGAHQTEHVHILLRRGVDILERLFPQIHDEMVAGDVRPFDFGRDLRWYQFGGWLPRQTSGIITFPQTRQSLEGHLRRRLMSVPNVRFETSTTVRGIVATSDGNRVTGVIAEGPGGKTTLPAALVVDAAGRGSLIYRWIEGLGHDPVPETALDIDLYYVSRFYQPPARARDWRGLWISPFPPAFSRAGALQLVEGDRWLLSLCGYHGDHPSIDPEHYESFASKLPDPAIAEAIAGAVPLSDPTPYRIPKTRWRHIERATRFPAGVVVLGDAYCTVDPIFGQGMTVAMVTCEWLGKHLDKLASADGLTADWTRGLYRDCSAWLRGMWNFVAGEALRHPATPGERTLLVRASQWYTEQIYGLSHEDPAVYGQFLRLMHMISGPEFLLRPDIALRMARRSGVAAPTTTRTPRASGGGLGLRGLARRIVDPRG